MKVSVDQLKNNWVLIVIAVFGGLAVSYILFGLMYIGRIYPGVYLNGVAVGGMTKQKALAAVRQKAVVYQGEILRVSYGKTVLQIPVKTLNLHYTDAAASDAYAYGRRGSLAEQAAQKLRAFFFRPSYVSGFTYDDAKLTPYVLQIDDDVAAPVANASLQFNDQLAITQAQPGARLDVGGLTLGIEKALGSMSAAVVEAPVSSVDPSITMEDLEPVKAQAQKLAAAPVTLQVANRTESISQPQIISWLNTSQDPQPEITVMNLTSFYPRPRDNSVSIALDQAKIQAYVADLAERYNHPGRNAVLGMQDGKVTVIQPSQDGQAIDRDRAYAIINSALTKDADKRTVSIPGKVAKAEINEDNLASLGITDQLSEGETFFPGSPSTRLINVRAGASKFNGVILKPGEVFSFGKLLGEVDASTGYVPELVILGDHEEKQYGGGLCQVSSTAFRAALQAGLPILERVNHAFAISYYTAPYGVPGVDATIYYPSVDFKFRNDTGHYILMQTIMQGTTLKFDFYGTKTKSGVIRGPQFVSGSTDATQPSHTVFWRDVLDASGKVVKTDQFDTWYKSSKDFPIQKQFN